MTQRKQLKLTDEEVVAIYNKEFKEEYDAMVDNIRTVVKGNTAFANTWKEWLGIGSISASVIVINAIFAILVALGLVSGFVTLGVGIAVAVVGVVAGIMFQQYRIHKNMKKYQDAEHFIENELNPENLELLRSKLQTELYPVLKDATPDEINYIVKSVIASLESLIINRQVKDFSELEKNSIQNLLVASAEKTPAVALNTKLINKILTKLPSHSDSKSKSKLQSSPKIKKHAMPISKCPEDSLLSKTHQTMWNKPELSDEEYQNNIEAEFKSTSVSLR